MRTVNLELAIKLKDAGFLQVTDFYWGVRKDNPDIALVYKNEDVMPHRTAAPTADEVLDLLPEKFEKDNYWFYLTIEKIIDSEDHWNGWNLCYKETGSLVFCSEQENTLADAAAKMWLWLKKKKLYE